MEVQVHGGCCLLLSLNLGGQGGQVKPGTARNDLAAHYVTTRSRCVETLNSHSEQAGKQASKLAGRHESRYSVDVNGAVGKRRGGQSQTGTADNISAEYSTTQPGWHAEESRFTQWQARPAAQGRRSRSSNKEQAKERPITVPATTRRLHGRDSFRCRLRCHCRRWG